MIESVCLKIEPDTWVIASGGLAEEIVVARGCRGGSGVPSRRGPGLPDEGVIVRASFPDAIGAHVSIGIEGFEVAVVRAGIAVEGWVERRRGGSWCRQGTWDNTCYSTEPSRTMNERVGSQMLGLAELT